MIIPFTLNFIHTRLFEEQVPTYHQIRGKKTAHRDKVCSWSANTIRALLDNRFYIGEFSYSKKEILTVGSHKPKKLPPSEWITIPEHHESVITRELFEKARYRKTGRNTRRKAPKHPLTGKLYCGGCGYAMIYKRKAGEKPYRHFECHKHSLLKIPACCTYYNAGVLEEIVLAMLNKELLKLLEYKDSREVLKTALKDRREILNKRIRGIGKQLKDIESDKVKRYEAYAEAKLDAEAYKQETASAEQEIAEKQEVLIRYKEDLTSTERAHFHNMEDLKQVLGYSQVDELTQEVMDSFIEKISVFKNKEVEIQWAFSFAMTGTEL